MADKILIDRELLERVQDVLSRWSEIINYQYCGSMEAMTYLQVADDMSQPVLNEVNATSDAPQQEVVVTDEMVAAYLDANKAYWFQYDWIEAPVGKWCAGTVADATRVSLLAALKLYTHPVPQYQQEVVAWATVADHGPHKYLVTAREKVRDAWAYNGREVIPLIHPAPSVSAEQNVPDIELPGMWEYADFSGGSTDSAAPSVSELAFTEDELNGIVRVLFDNCGPATANIVRKALSAAPKAPRHGEPCSHPGCLSHVSHPCEGCGRVAGMAPKAPTTDDRKDAERYRFAKSRAYVGINPHSKRCLWVLRGIDEVSYNAAKIHGFDAAIDAAIAAQKGEKE